MAHSPRGERPLLISLLLSLRPQQWTKNLFVFGALVFAQRLTSGPDVLRATVAFLVFCALSGAVYLVNDVLDREQDQRHPLKARRPIASGTVGTSLAIGTAICLGAGALGVGLTLGLQFFATAVAYLALLWAYSAF